MERYIYIYLFIDEQTLLYIVEYKHLRNIHDAKVLTYSKKFKVHRPMDKQYPNTLRHLSSSGK